jgi:phosphoribosylformylglycinamidine cyclo-ligase
MAQPVSYKDAGVNIDEADRAVANIRRMARATFTKGVLTEIGSFGGCFALPKMRQPVLVSSVDGVGTKLKVAFAAGRHNTIGEDLVNHCVNDIAVQGAKPLFFLDYLAVGRLEAHVAAEVVSGIARGCSNNGCALIGGETAEMPGMYQDGEYDIAGTIVGVVEKSRMLTGAKVRAGDALVALRSTGLHTNGYSLARKLLFDVAKMRVDSALPYSGAVLADELLQVHRSYLKAIQGLLSKDLLSAAAHITGGGITDNLPRVLPKGLAATIETGSWEVPPLFRMLRSIGDVPEADWRRTFNLGVGMILVTPQRKLDTALRLLKREGEKPWVIGQVAQRRRGKGRVEYV